MSDRAGRDSADHDKRSDDGRPDDRRPGGKPDSGRPSRSGPAKGAPRGGGGPRGFGNGDAPRGAGRSPERGGSAGARGERNAGRGSAPRDSAPRGSAARGGGRDGGRRDSRPPQEDPSEFDPYGTRSVRSRHDDPIIPDDVQPSELDRVARAQLKTLTKENADVVAMHLAMAARLIGTDPQLAHRHAVSAARKAGRIAVVRESLAITAYTIGDYALALRELRTYRRISGRDDQLPMMVDCERGLGRPGRALELGRSVPRGELPNDVQVELAIAMSGARLDLAQSDAALAELEIPQLDPARAFSWSPALFAAYATVLEDLGRASEAEKWFARAEIAQDALDGAGTDEDEDVVEIIEEELEEEFQADEPAADAGDDAAGGGDTDTRDADAER